MPHALLISVRFHEGRYHGAGDWPPSPARLFQALVAGAARGDVLSAEDAAALRWLEELKAPIIAAPAARTGSGFRNYVPNNDLDAVGGDLRRIGEIRTPKPVRPRLFDAAERFLYAWPFARVRIVPLPSIGHPHADHAIRRVMVEIPPDCPIAHTDVEWAFSGLYLGADHETGEILDESQPLLVRADDDAMLDQFGIGSSKPTRVWRTVTPAALPQSACRRRIDPQRLRDPAERKGAMERAAEEERAAGAVIQAVRHVGLGASVTGVRVRREPFTGRGERAERFAPGTRFAKERLWHIEITFARAVSGPLIIGDGRYLGLGLTEPIAAHCTDLAVFTLVSASRITTSDRSALLKTVRRALMSLSRRDDGSVPRLFSGHEEDGAPAKSGRHEHVFLSAADLNEDEYIDTVMVAAPWRCDHAMRPSGADTALFDRVVTSLGTIRAGRLGVISLDMHPGGSEDSRLVGPSRIWASHSWYRPTCPVRRGDDPADVIRRDVNAECRRRGLPVPEVELLDCSSGSGQDITARPRLTFAVAVRGPLVLGRDSHQGGGLLLAEI